MDIVVPELGESIVEATVARWLKKEGEPVSVGEPVVALETDKVDLEVGAKEDGVLVSIAHKEGDDVKVGEVLGVIQPGESSQSGPSVAAEKKQQAEEASAQATQEANPTTRGKTVAGDEERMEQETGASGKDGASERATPVARRMAQEQGIDLTLVQPAGDRVTKEDVQRYLEQKDTSRATPVQTVTEAQQREVTPPAARVSESTPSQTATRQAPSAAQAGERQEERVKMSRRRRTIAARLVEAQRTAAMLTTFNDVDMSAVIEVRNRRKEAFQQRYGVKLGFMSFFVKASIGALKEFPAVNAEVQGEEIVYKYYYDIGMAIGAEEGLVVPVLRDADRMSFAKIEQAIQDYVEKARTGTLSLDDLRGGTFTITNGGVFGSLLSTPILNPPQVGILGLHRIEERPIAVNGQVAVHPMMYMALSYDHRIVDGREAVQFLARIKELIEDPEALLLEG